MSLYAPAHLPTGVSDVASEVQDGHVLGVVGDSQFLLPFQRRAQRSVGEHVNEAVALETGGVPEAES